MPDEDKPREKLIKHGPSVLSIHELLAIVLSVGTRKEEVLTMSSRIIKEYGEKSIINQTKGRPITIRTPKQAYEYLKDMRELSKEHLRGLYLNSRHVVIHDEVISIGSLTANIVHPREVFKPAIEYSAVAVIIAHNHPSGTIKPTKSDIEITKQLLKAGKILGIDLIDHIIIGKNKFISIPADYD